MKSIWILTVITLTILVGKVTCELGPLPDVEPGEEIE